jgi:hypothetical protein
MRHDQTQRFLVVWQRQEVVEIFALVRGPGEMTRDEDRIDHVDESSRPLEVRMVDPADAADGDAHRVNGNRVLPRDLDQELRGMRVSQEILGMNFQPRGWRSGGRDLRDVRKPETDACPTRGATIWRCRHGHPSVAMIRASASCCRLECGGSSLRGHRSMPSAPC